MSLHRYVVLAQRVGVFDEFERAKEYALANVPSVVCERKVSSDGQSRLVEKFFDTTSCTMRTDANGASCWVEQRCSDR